MNRLVFLQISSSKMNTSCFITQRLVSEAQSCRADKGHILATHWKINEGNMAA